MGTLLGTIRRFGLEGPAYEVLGAAESGAGDPCLRIRVFESGEELDYPVSAVLNDPADD